MATPRLRKRVMRGVLVSVVILGAVVGMLWALQRRLIYFPDATPVPPAGDVIAGARDVTLHTATARAGRLVRPGGRPGDTGMAVLVAPGNGGNRAGRAGFAEELSRRGLAVLLMDYRGYGGNPGSPSQDGLAADADAAVEALKDLGYPPRRTLYFGESLGSAVVAALQARHPPAGWCCARRSPSWPTWVRTTTRGCRCARCCATGSRDGAPRHQRRPGDRHLRRPDSVVPPSSAPASQTMPAPAERLVIAGADHNDPVMFGPRVADAVARMAERVA